MYWACFYLCMSYYLVLISLACGVVAMLLLHFVCCVSQLPQQENSFDCGLFLLHFAELFLEDAPDNFNPFRITKFCSFVSNLLSSWPISLSSHLLIIFLESMNMSCDPSMTSIAPKPDILNLDFCCKIWLPLTYTSFLWNLHCICIIGKDLA